MRALIKNLEGKLSKNDPRWLEFGLNLPGASATPGQRVTFTLSVAKAAGYPNLAKTEEAPATGENGNGNGHARPARVA